MKRSPFRRPVPARRRSVARLGHVWLLLAFGALLPACAFAGGESVAALPPASTLKAFTVEQLMDLDVTSVSKRPEKLFETASAIQVITADDIRRSGATSIPEALRLASNLEVAQIDSRQWAITARGFNNVFADKMLVLIDGRSVYTPLYAGVYWDVQDTLMEDLDRIEVISGSGATQWGANAVNGVINITTKSAKDTQGGLLTGGVGTALRDSFGARYGGQLAPGVFYRVYSKYTERDDSVRPNGRNSEDAWHMIQGGFRVDWDAVAQDTFTVQGDGYNGVLGQPGPDSIRVNGLNVLGRWTHPLAPNSDLKVQAYFDRTHRRIPGSFTQDLNTGDFDFQHRLPVGNAHDIVWGFGYRVVADDIVNTPANACLPPKVTREWFNAFAQDEITVVKDRFVVTVGTKIEHDGYTGVQFEPSLRAAWTPNKRTTVWAAVSRAVRTPSRVDRDLFSPAVPPYRVAGGEKVVSEKLLSYELGYRVQASPGLLLSVATFLNDYNDLRSLEPLSPPLAFPVEASSGLLGWSYGAELTAEWRVAPTLRLRGGYTELRVQSEAQPGNHDRSTRDSIARDPNHQASLRFLWDFSSRWELDTELRYVARISNQSVPGYTEGNLRLGWSPNSTWELSLVGENLIQKRHAEFNAFAGRRDISRSIFAKASWRF
jgi:iron complex outermembrane receptor protein